MAPFSPQQEIRRSSANCYRLYYEKIGLQVCQFFWDQPPEELFYPHQLGLGTPAGCEAAVHAARRYLESLPSNHVPVLVKLDFTNAFNSFHRREMLLSIYSRVPELYAYCQSAYRYSSCLFLARILFCLRRVPNKGTLLFLCSSATQFTPRWNMCEA